LSLEVIRRIARCDIQLTTIAANIGLGKASCLALAKHNPEYLYLFCRNAGKAADAIEEVKAVAPNVNASFIECDLSSLASVKKAAEEFNSRSPRLDVLMCNAGISWIHPETTIDGYEMNFRNQPSRSCTSHQAPPSQAPQDDRYARFRCSHRHLVFHVAS
jgi:NAD(P)-dependent dehydrogenase (short-subunit alcohol dehydrogenase family)